MLWPFSPINFISLNERFTPLSSVFKVTAIPVQCKRSVFCARTGSKHITLQKKSMGNYNYKQQYGIVVICKDEEEQKAVYERLKAQGLTLKVVCV